MTKFECLKRTLLVIILVTTIFFSVKRLLHGSVGVLEKKGWDVDHNSTDVDSSTNETASNKARQLLRQRREQRRRLMLQLDPKTVQTKTINFDPDQQILDDDASFTDSFMDGKKHLPGTASDLFQDPNAPQEHQQQQILAQQQQKQTQGLLHHESSQKQQQQQQQQQQNDMQKPRAQPIHSSYPHQHHQEQTVATTTTTTTTTAATTVNDPPVIYTFWGPVTPMKNNGQKGTGMTIEADETMMELWKAHWTAIGWEPRVLTIEDAKKHSRYDEFYEKLQQVPLWGKRRAGVNREYNMHCYMRWLAMAAVAKSSGGGWMSDYDVLPIRPIHHPIGPVFTAYSAGLGGRGVPCLLAGTAQEWERMAFAILENGLSHPEAELWSDMMAFMDVKTTAPYLTNKTVIEADPLMTGKSWTNYECQLLEKFEAIHFSHNSIVEGVLREGESFRDRPTIAVNIMKLYQQKCKPTDHTFQTEAIQLEEGRTPQLQHTPEGVNVVPMNRHRPQQQITVAEPVQQPHQVSAVQQPPSPEQQQVTATEAQQPPHQAVGSSTTQVVTSAEKSAFDILNKHM